MRLLVLGVALSVVALSGCSGSSNPPSPSAAPVGSATAPASPSSSPRATPPADGTIDPLGFGSTDPVSVKANPDPSQKQALLVDVRIGAHPEEGGWDRIVFEFGDQLPAADIAYEAKAVGCASGLDVQVQGGALVLVRLHAVDAHDEAGKLTVPATRIAGPGSAILEAVETCDFEGQVGWAIGLKSKTRFKVSTLTNPTRLVIDVKW